MPYRSSHRSQRQPHAVPTVITSELHCTGSCAYSAISIDSTLATSEHATYTPSPCNRRAHTGHYQTTTAINRSWLAGTPSVAPLPREAGSKSDAACSVISP